MKQTAVEWLYEQIDNKDMGEIPMWVYNFIEQAKEMEREQIIEACNSQKNDADICPGLIDDVLLYDPKHVAYYH